MKLPEKILGQNKIRDAGICNEWMSKSLNSEELAEKLNLTERRILQILRTNHAFIIIDKEWEKKKRIHRRNRWIKDREKNGEASKKDLDDLLEANRREIEGERATVDNSQHKYFTFQVSVNPDELSKQINERFQNQFADKISKRV